MIPQMRDYLFYARLDLRFVNAFLIIKALSLKIIHYPASVINYTFKPGLHLGLYKV